MCSPYRNKKKIKGLLFTRIICKTLLVLLGRGHFSLVLGSRTTETGQFVYVLGTCNMYWVVGNILFVFTSAVHP